MNSMTVAQLKTLAGDMNLSVPSKARKAEIIDLITAEIDRVHAEAIEIEQDKQAFREWISTPSAECFKKAVTDYKLSRVEGFKVLAGKVNTYMRFNGTDKLTPAQWRRVRKAMRKHAVTSIDMGPFYVFP